MRGGKGVVDVAIGEAGQRPREPVVVGLLLLVETQVLEEQHLSRLERARLFTHLVADTIRSERHRQREQRGEPLGHRAQRELWGRLALGPSEMRGEHHRCPGAERVLNGGDHRAQAGVVRHRAAIGRRVQVGPQEDALAGKVELLDRELRHRVRNAVRASLR